MRLRDELDQPWILPRLHPVFPLVRVAAGFGDITLMPAPATISTVAPLSTDRRSSRRRRDS